MKKFDAVVFDMDGVIFDSERCVVECWKEIADKYNIPDIEDACRECMGINATLTTKKMHERYGEDFPYAAYKKEMSDLFHSRYGGGRLPIKPGVVELLSFLKENGIKVALASSTRKEVVHRELADAGIIKYFDEIVCGDMVEKSKPEPDIFLKACELLSVEPENAYGIEDSHNGVRAAAAAGLHTIMVLDLMPETEEMRQLTKKVFTSLHEVKAYFEG